MTATANVKANVHATGDHRDMPAFQRLKPLLADYSSPCLSLYIPTFRAFPDSQQNQVKYRNALRELKAKLEQKHGGADHAALLEPFERLADDTAMWAHPQDGMAVFGAPGFFHVEKVQRPVQALTVVNDHLYIRPLVRVFQSEDSYQILALDRKEIRLYQGNRYVLDEVVLAPSVPRTIDEALGPNVHQQGVERMATHGAGKGGQTATAHHGHGSKKDEVGIDIERFFRVIDRAIAEAHSKPSQLPLILAALPEYHTHFHQISHNPQLLEEGIHANADALSIDQLRDEAWRLMQPRYQARLQQIVDMYHAQKARAMATDDLTHAVEFAMDGRVGTLIVEGDRRIPGQIDGRIPHRAVLRDDPNAGDILDDLAERVLKTGGQVIVAPKASMPSDTGLAAIFRY
jgi:Bacterial archaeo-eukaryotic release factor family 3